MDETNPFADRRTRSLVGLSSGLAIAVVAVVFLEGRLRWAALGIAAVDAVATPYVLTLAIEEQRR